MSDDPVLRRILEEEEIRTTDGGPAIGSWLADIGERFADEAQRAVTPALGTSAPWIAGGILAIAGVIALVIGWHLVRVLRAQGPVTRLEVAAAAPLPTPTAPPSRAEIEQRLAAADARGALAALSRWVGSRLETQGLARAVPSRTNRELLAEVRRTRPTWERLPALRELTDRVDGLLYAGVPLDTRSVAELLPTADEITR